MIFTTIFTVLPGLCSALAVGSNGVGKRSSHDLFRRQDVPDAKCSWESPGSAIIRDRLYISGGRLKTGNFTLRNGEWKFNGQLAVDDTPDAAYYLNLGTPFKVSDPPFHSLPISFRDLQTTYGFMAANDYSFWLYGGLDPFTDSNELYPVSNAINSYDYYLQGPERTWEEGWQNSRALSNGVHRYVAAGAGVNVPQINKAFYFSGIRNSAWGQIKGPGAVLDQYRANVTSRQFITADLDTQERTQWHNTTLPQHVRPRTSAELVYVPTGQRGTLVAIGGVTNAFWMDDYGDDDATRQRNIKMSVQTGPTFMKTVEIYDIESETWYLQNTTGDFPPATAQHCAVVASAPDGSSHQIYVYGGYPGQAFGDIKTVLDEYDHVYALSVPAFEWIKVYNGDKNMGRRGHRCLKPFDDQMLVVGGIHGQGECLEPSIVRVFNLNDLEFKDEYDPKKYGSYKVPEPVYNVIGGNAEGGATKTITRWATPTLETIFLSDRPPSNTRTWYPYPSVGADETSAPTVSTIVTKETTPKFVYPVVAVCIVVVLAIIGGCLYFLWLRRKKQREQAKAAGHEQFHHAPPEKDEKMVDYYHQYPSNQTSPYNTVNSMSTLAYGHHRQYSNDGNLVDQSGGMVHELPSDRNPVEMDAGTELILAQKLAVVKENENEPLSITPTPATEVSDPMGTANTNVRRASQRTARVSVFSEMTSSNDDDLAGIVSPLSPDPEITTDPMTTANAGATNTTSEGSWWRKRGSRTGSKTSRRFSSFSSSKSGRE